MIYCVEVLAIYEVPGVTPTAGRITARNNDVALAQSRSAAVPHYAAPGTVPPEQITAFGQPGDPEPYSRYGFGWRARVWLNTAQDGGDTGRALATRLSTRTPRDGSKVEVFEHHADEGNPYATGALLFKQSWPPRPDDVP